jgi:ATP-dependent Clp protease adaptor protein ClpS
MGELTQSGVPTVEPELDDTTGASGHGGWVVTVFNNDYNTWDEVVGILMRATSCGIDEAQMETWEVHHLGQSVVHHGGENECKSAADIIATIGIRVTVTEE